MFCAPDLDAGAGDGNRTHIASLGSWSSATELHPRKEASPLLQARGKGVFKQLVSVLCRDAENEICIENPPRRTQALPMRLHGSNHYSIGFTGKSQHPKSCDSAGSLPQYTAPADDFNRCSMAHFPRFDRLTFLPSPSRAQGRAANRRAASRAVLFRSAEGIRARFPIDR